MAQLGGTKRTRAIQLYQNSKGVFRCPVCGRPLFVASDNRLCCEQRHSFDFSSKGYVNFLRLPPRSHYDKALFVARGAIYGKGYFDPLVDAVKTALRAHSKYTGRMLDAGCGEGFFAAQIKADEDFSRAEMYAMDINKEAVAYASRYGADVRFCVADLAALPFIDDAMDAVVNILTPANYAEFTRVLHSKDGILIKVLPGAHYLEEIRGLIERELLGVSHVTDTLRYVRRHVDVFSERTISYQHPVTEGDAMELYRMTPMTKYVAPPEKLREINEITVDLKMVIGCVG